MSAADKAVANAIPLEVKKDSLRQMQNGDWRVSFTVQAADMDSRLTGAPMGTRYQAALVEVNDDETPVEQPKGKLEWRQVQPTAQVSIRCGEARFRDYLAVEHGFGAASAEEAVAIVRHMCGIESRTELATNHKARALWHSIDNGYRSWAHL